MISVSKPLLSLFFYTVNKYNLIKKNERLLVGISGGPDSVFLVFSLLEYQNVIPFTIALAYVNYHLRGSENEFETQIISELSKKFSLNLHTLDAYIEDKTNLQHKARKIRYNFYNELINTYSYTKVALGHNLDDNIETFMINLFRGGSLLSLSGIPVKRGPYIRPLINLRKSDIITYLNNKNIRYSIDSSNLESHYLRNKFRLEILPFLKNYFPGLDKRILSFIEEAESFNRFWDNRYKIMLNNVLIQSSERDMLILRLDSLRNYDTYSLTAFLHKLIKEKYGVLLRSVFLKKISFEIKHNHSKIEHIVKSLHLIREYSNLVIYPKKQKSSLKLPINLKEEKITIVDTNNISIRVKRIYNINNNEIQKLLQKKAIFFKCNEKTEFYYLRYRKPGDRIRTQVGLQKLQDIFTDKKIPKRLRDSIPLLCRHNRIIGILFTLSSIRNRDIIDINFYAKPNDNIMVIEIINSY